MSVIYRVRVIVAVLDVTQLAHALLAGKVHIWLDLQFSSVPLAVEDPRKQTRTMDILACTLDSCGNITIPIIPTVHASV